MCKTKKQHTCVVVLGDYGRSPRMQYHTLSLAKNNFEVSVVAYKGADPLEEITKNKNIHFYYLKDTPKFESYFPKLIVYFLKTLWQSFFLFFTLMRVSSIDHILLQNPPSIPTLPVCYFVSLLCRCDMIIDYHNYGYTLLSLSLRKSHILVKICRWCEKYFGRKAQKTLCVSKAMKEDLMHNWNINSTVFYDFAPEIFHQITLAEKHAFFSRISEEYEQFKGKSYVDDGEYTRFTIKKGNEYYKNPDRPAFILSSTSWTDDEDFSVLLAALEDYEQATKSVSDLPDLLVAITGKGPLKTYYEKEIEKKGFTHIEIMTLWLKSEDYPTFLACADLGVCLHGSSSGLDLPMKVVDMFGCCLPVCAVEFKSIGELVKDGINGRIFSSSIQLSRQLQHLFQGFPNRSTDIDTFRNNLANSGRLQWEENWSLIIYPLFQELKQHSI